MLSFALGPLQAQVLKCGEGEGLRSISIPEVSASPTIPLLRGSLFRVVLAGPLRWDQWQSRARLEAEFFRPVYSEGQVAIPSKSLLVFEIEKVETAHVKRKDHRSSPSTVSELLQFVFRKEQSHRVTLRSATVVLPSGARIPVHVSFMSVAERAPLGPSKKENGELDSATGLQMKTVPPPKQGYHAELILRLEEHTSFPTNPSISKRPLCPSDGVFRIKAGTQARLMLLNELSAFTNREGDLFQARLEEPIVLDAGTGLPEGALFEGRIVKRVPPRRLNRGGRLHLSFDRLRLPSGYTAAISASLSGGEGERSNSLNLDTEGTLSAGSKGKAAVLLNVGTSWLIGKAVDDLIEEGFRWSAEAVASGTAATAARYVGLGVGAALVLIERGRDVFLPQFAKMEVTINRPVTLDLTQGRTETATPPGPAPNPDFSPPRPQGTKTKP